ncbi:hypothetical protein AJ79_06230 [Helicocarpus griseus UAMH5409]|uniref:RING-type domain-containing protein n=1 Tax=Helicocarpus griseus UAMH5409 TaxID=1447875 RepID=A0A2B7XF77_9EURO|nr:hypothetical protein AJ79_06230 [Helicocarpus griseus UAMH5409]
MDPFLDSTSDDIEVDDIYQSLYGDSAMPPDLARSQPSFIEDNEFDNDLQQVSTSASDPQSTASSDSDLAALQRRIMLETEDDSTSRNSPHPLSSAGSNTASQTSFRDQHFYNSDLPTMDNNVPPLPDFDDSGFPEISGYSNGRTSTTPSSGSTLPGARVQLPSSRKRSRTATDAGSPTKGHSGSKSRKATPAPAAAGRSSSGLNNVDLCQLLDLPDSDDFDVLEREQREAEEWLLKKKEQERADEEFARSLQQSWNEPEPVYSTGPSSFNHSNSTRGLGSMPPPFALAARAGNPQMDKKTVGKPFSNMAGPASTNRNKSGESSSASRNYVEISSDSEIEEFYPAASHTSAGPSNPWHSNHSRTTPVARPLWPKPETIGATSSNFSYSCNIPTMPQVRGNAYPSYSSNQSTSLNPFIPGGFPSPMGNSYSSYGYNTQSQPSNPYFNTFPNPFNNPYSFDDDIMEMISQTAADIGTSGMNTNALSSRIYDQMTPGTSKDDLKKLLENIRPDKDFDRNREGTPAALKLTLMEHQKLGLAWMKSMEEGSNKGGILADDMGLGKTIQALALMVSRPATDPARQTTLIIAPVALIQQWKREIERVIKPEHRLKVFVFHNERRSVKYKDLKKHDVVLTTFGTLASELKRKEFADRMRTENPGTYQNLHPDAIHLPLLGENCKWYRVIVDEAQCIKNKSTKSAQACYSLDSTYRWCMSGTPMMNNVGELYSLIKFLRIAPYNNVEKFISTFATPLKSFDEGRQSRAMQQLQALLKAILLRRTKTSEIDGKRILRLPPRTTEKVHAVFSEDEQALYTALETKTQLQFNKYLRAGTIGRNYSNVLVLLLRLRQACCHPHLMTDFGVEANADLPVDLIKNAKKLPKEVVARLKENEASECPVCIDAVENAVIFFPCGHSTCAECFARISDPAQAMRQGHDGAFTVKCPNCRAKIDPKRITDNVSFKRVHCSESVENGAEGGEDGGDESGDGDDRKGKGKAKEAPKKSLLQLKKEATKSAEAKRVYLQHLAQNWETSAKIEKTMQLLHQVQSRTGPNSDGPEKTIIFSQFTSLLDLLEVPINREGWGYRRYDGSMRPDQRNEAVLEFSDNKDCTIMLVSLKAGNSGLNLVAASQVIIFDPFWNPYIEEQAIDRAHRIGQLRPVKVHRILVENTVEDRILSLQDKKRNLIEGALDEKASKNIGRLDSRELAFLFPWGFTKPKQAHFYTDASRYAIGLVITQFQDDPDRPGFLIEVPILFDSLTLSPTERRYGAYKRELLAIIKFVTKYPFYLQNHHLPGIIHTDHKPLVTFLRGDNHEGIYATWVKTLRILNCSISYVPGTQNVVADGLSRTIFQSEDCGESEEVISILDELNERGPSWVWKDRKRGEVSVITASAPGSYNPV